MQLSQIGSLDLQISYFIDKLQSSFIDVCQGITEADHKDDKEVLITIAKILEALLPQTEYLVKTKNSYGQEQLNVYVDAEYQALLKRKCKKLYKAFAFGINALITQDHSHKLQLSCLRLLKRLFEVFDQHKHVLEDTIITCLQNIAEIEDVKKHKQAALYYYHLINSLEVSEAFKQKVRDDKNLEIFKYNPHYSSIYYHQ